MLEKLTIQDFSGLLNETFQLELDSDEGDIRITVFDMALVEVSPLGERQSAPGMRKGFSILFKGPESPLLTQKIYSLTHEKLGTLPLFIVPIGPGNGGMLYEAVFN